MTRSSRAWPRPVTATPPISRRIATARSVAASKTRAGGATAAPPDSFSARSPPRFDSGGALVRQYRRICFAPIQEYAVLDAKAIQTSRADTVGEANAET